MGICCYLQIYNKNFVEIEEGKVGWAVLSPQRRLKAKLPCIRNPEKEKEEGNLPSSAFPHCALLSLNSHNLTAIVGTASLASSVGSDGLTTLGAHGNGGSGQLPVGATALIAAGLGHFTLRDSHGDTSLVKLLLTA